jgi:hypothetical protein
MSPRSTDHALQVSRFARLKCIAESDEPQALCLRLWGRAQSTPWRLIVVLRRIAFIRALIRVCAYAACLASSARCSRCRSGEVMTFISFQS